MKSLCVFFTLAILCVNFALADTPPPSTVQIKGATNGTPIGNTGNALNVSVTNSPSSTVTQGPGGLSPWLVNINNTPLSVTGTFWQSIQPVSQSGSWSVLQSGAWTTGRTWNLGHSGDSISSWTFDGSGNAIGSTSGALNVNVTNGGSSTVNQGNAGVQSWLVDVTNTVPVTGAFFQATQPISSVSLPLPTGAATNAELVTINSTLGSPFQAGGSIGNTSFIATQSTGSNLHTDVDNFPSTFGVTQSTSPWVISGSITTSPNVNIHDGTGNSIGSVSSSLNVDVTNTVPVTGAFFQSVQPVSQSGSWTVAATQSGSWTTGRTWNLLNTTDSVNVGNFPATQAVTQSTSPWVVSGTVTANQGTSPWVVSGTVTANAGTNLNTSALALDTTVSGLQVSQGSTTSGQNGSLIQGAVTTNQPSYTTAQTSPLSLTLRGGLRSKGIGLDTVSLIRNVYSSTNVTTSAYVQLVASTSLEINRLLIFDSSGQDLVLAVGGAGSEVDQIQIPPGGWDSAVELYIPSASRISVKAVSATASSGILLITGLK